MAPRKAAREDEVTTAVVDKAVAIGASVADVVLAAQHILMRRYRLAAREAAHLLVSISEQQQIPLRVLAERLQTSRKEAASDTGSKPPRLLQRRWLRARD